MNTNSSNQSRFIEKPIGLYTDDERSQRRINAKNKQIKQAKIIVAAPLAALALFGGMRAGINEVKKVIDGNVTTTQEFDAMPKRTISVMPGNTVNGLINQVDNHLNGQQMSDLQNYIEHEAGKDGLQPSQDMAIPIIPGKGIDPNGQR